MIRIQSLYIYIQILRRFLAAPIGGDFFKIDVSLAKEWQMRNYLDRVAKTTSNARPILTRWLPPQGYIKPNIDGSIRGDPNPQHFVLLNSKGEMTSTVKSCYLKQLG